MSLNLQNRVLEKLTDLNSRGFPHHGAFELTGRCNARCGYCYLKGEESRDLDLNQVKEIIDRLSKEGLLTLLLTGGELFIRDDIIEILSYVVEKRFFEVTLLSNGTLINDDHIKFLADNLLYINNIRISFFSHVPEIHDNFIGIPGGFNRALNSAKKLIEGGLKVFAMINVMDFNVDDLHETLEFFRSLGLKTYTATSKNYVFPSIRQNYEKLTSKEFYRSYFEKMDKETLVKLKKELNDRLAAPVDLSTCGKLSSSISVNHRGELVPCIVFRNAPTADLLLDNRSIHEIISTSQFCHELRNLQKSDIEKCSTCEFINFCSLCPGAMHSEHGTIYRNQEQNCNYVHALSEMVIKDE